MINYRGVIGKKLPSDTTLKNMRKRELIELLHIAEHNHRVLAETYMIAVETSKCLNCPISIDARKTEQIKADMLDKFENGIYEFGYYDSFSMKIEIYREDLKRLIEQLKEEGEQFD